MGGKSRKSGGVSRKLVALLKAGAYGSTKKCGSGSTVNKEKTAITTLFDADAERGN